MALERRTALRRTGPPPTRARLARGRAGLARQSARRRSERAARSAVVEAARRRDGGRCVAAELVPEIECWGPLDGDEIVLRSGRPGGHLDVDNVQTICRGHHEWKDRHPAEAVARGLRRWSHS